MTSQTPVLDAARAAYQNAEQNRTTTENNERQSLRERLAKRYVLHLNRIFEGVTTFGAANVVYNSDERTTLPIIVMIEGVETALALTGGEERPAVIGRCSNCNRARVVETFRSLAEFGRAVVRLEQHPLSPETCPFNCLGQAPIEP